ncbi:mechanosensitive ion channel family protein [Shimia abyssi]|uniref:Small-conductance mechanosensitive channel n=1 Tax=Shimia abyssi TaxID=1662395 RepID=A0A2P8FC83_9RHOB|nr:mechanosensitive ion channel family protein [Shimia abyssi]PSL19336.1 small conductance mechanosensitive channel [Shimia abyssi]
MQSVIYTPVHFVRIFFLTLTLVASLVTNALASDALMASASDVNVPLADIEVMVVPLTVEELTSLADIWQGHQASAMELYVTENLKLRTLSGAAADAVRNQIAQNAERGVAIRDNYQAVLRAWAAKGGVAEDIAKHQDYINALSVAALKSSDTQTLVSIAMDWVFSRDGGLGLLIQIAVFFVALLVLIALARFVRRMAERGLLKLPSVSKLLRGFILTVVYWITIVLGLMIALGIAGVNVTPLFAVFGGLSFILGFALQDTLGNLASGLMIMVLKPFDTGDYIEIAGTGGVVDSMSVVSTQIRTFDNQIIVVPNSKIWGDVITNVSAADTRRVDMVFGIAYSDSAPQAIEVLKKVVAADPRCLQDPPPEIFVGELGDSSVNVFCRPWAATEDYWDVYWGITGVVKETFDAEGISIPFPQRDVHLIKE